MIHVLLHTSIRNLVIIDSWIHSKEHCHVHLVYLHLHEIWHLQIHSNGLVFQVGMAPASRYLELP